MCARISLYISSHYIDPFIIVLQNHSTALCSPYRGFDHLGFRFYYTTSASASLMYHLLGSICCNIHTGLASIYGAIKENFHIFGLLRASKDTQEISRHNHDIGIEPVTFRKGVVNRTTVPTRTLLSYVLELSRIYRLIT